MRLFVALGIAAVALALLAGKLTRHHRRVLPPPGLEEAESESASPAEGDRHPPPRPRTAATGPTLRELLDKAAAAAPAVIRGHARGPQGVPITVRVSPAGKHERGRSFRVEDGAFEIPGLLFGRSYDLTFDGPDLRRTTLRSVTAPAEDVAAQLEPLPILRGAIGFPAGGQCGYDQVALKTDEADEEVEAAVGLDETCRFELTVPDGPTQMVLVATGEGHALTMPIAIPPGGDPAPVCLNPPCLAKPETARLRIAFAGADHTDLSATLTPVAGDDSSSYNCFSNGEDCQLDTLPINRPFTLSAEATDCATATRTITLHAGDNDVALPCPPPSLEALANDPDGDENQEDVPGDIQGEILIR